MRHGQAKLLILDKQRGTSNASGRAVVNGYPTLAFLRRWQEARHDGDRKEWNMPGHYEDEAALRRLEDDRYDAGDQRPSC